MLQAIVLLLAFSLLAACGSSLDTAKKFREEKDDRIEAQRALNEALIREEQLKNLMQKATTTENYIWVWNVSIDVSDYNEARKVCTDIGFDLPTKTMLVEANRNETIKNGTTAFSIGQVVFILDQPDELALIVLCAKPR